MIVVAFVYLFVVSSNVGVVFSLETKMYRRSLLNIFESSIDDRCLSQSSDSSDNNSDKDTCSFRRIPLRESGICCDLSVFLAPEFDGSEVLFVDEFALDPLDITHQIIIFPNFDPFPHFFSRRASSLRIPDSIGRSLPSFVSAGPTLLVFKELCCIACRKTSNSSSLSPFVPDIQIPYGWFYRPEKILQQISEVRQSIAVLISATHCINGCLRCGKSPGKDQSLVFGLMDLAQNFGIDLDHGLASACSPSGDSRFLLPTLSMIDEFLMAADSSIRGFRPFSHSLSGDADYLVPCSLSITKDISAGTDADKAEVPEFISLVSSEESVIVDHGSLNKSGFFNDDRTCVFDDYSTRFFFSSFGLASVLVFLSKSNRKSLLADARAWRPLLSLTGLPVMFFLKKECCVCRLEEDRFFLGIFDPTLVLDACDSWTPSAIISYVPRIISSFRNMVSFLETCPLTRKSVALGRLKKKAEKVIIKLEKKHKKEEASN
jgi:hypothetical protein